MAHRRPWQHLLPSWSTSRLRQRSTLHLSSTAWRLRRDCTQNQLPSWSACASRVRCIGTCRRARSASASGAAPSPVSSESRMFVPRCNTLLTTVSITTLLRIRPLRKRDLRRVFPRTRSRVLSVATTQLCMRVYYAEMSEMFKRVIGAAHAHVFHHQLRTDRHNAGGNGFNTSPASAASYVACCVFSLLRGTQRTSTMRPTTGAQALTMSSLMPWNPCLSGSALHCRVPFSPW